MTHEITDALCADCDIPAVREGNTFWCLSCGKHVTITYEGER